jgi:restriction system protein
VQAASGSTPEEIIDAAYGELRSALADELVERVKAQTPEFFEDLVLDVLIAMGYGGTRADAAERLGRSGDGGIDGVIREDALGLDQIYVQAKRWGGSVGRPVIQGFVGALHGAHADRGVLITTSHFTPDATSYARNVPARVILIDGQHLAELMIDYGVGVTETTRYELKRIDGDYFPDDAASEVAPADGDALR